MELSSHISPAGPRKRQAKKTSHGLRFRIVAVLLCVSLLPMVLMGAGAWVVFGRLLKEKSQQLQRTMVQGHARSIDFYLAEHLRAIDLAARSYKFEELCENRVLRNLLEMINLSYDRAFVDLGVINSAGEHLAYVGPFDLRDKNYATETWFRDVMARGTYVSDVFLGFRGIPHCVIAIRRRERGRTWILRATINSDKFEWLVQTGRLGKTGDAFIINARGLYQTQPRIGNVLDRSTIARPKMHRGVRLSRVPEGGKTMLRATSWINGGRWMFVVQQDEAEINAPLRRAMILGSVVILSAILMMVVTTVLATWHLTGRIDRAHAERDALSQDLLRSSKLASLGELSAGLAHEINNPLAIMSAEHTNITDLLTELDDDVPGRQELLDSAERCRRQVERCGGITAKMLQFGRKGESIPRPTDVVPRLNEVVRLMAKQAETSNVELRLEAAPNLPPLLVDPSELEQVVANLVNNSLHAIDGQGRIMVSARREGPHVVLSVTDNGSGIAPEDLQRVFQPFFTTKPPGKGTGLGLSVCYGIVRNWGGNIEAKSEPGRGTEVIITLPVTDAGPGTPRKRGVSW